MTRFTDGQDVRVTFCGRDHDAEVVHESNGWVLCVINTDSAWDYGSLTSRMDPRQTVCVRADNVSASPLP